MAPHLPALPQNSLENTPQIAGILDRGKPIGIKYCTGESNSDIPHPPPRPAAFTSSLAHLPPLLLLQTLTREPRHADDPWPVTCFANSPNRLL